MKVLIVGCGYVGTHLARELKGKNHDVWALRRGPLSLRELASLGIHTFEGDITRANTLESLPHADVIVFAQAPKNVSDTYRNVYYLGTKNILKMSEGKKPKKVIFISSTSVYSTKNGAWVDESAELFKEEYESPEAEANAKCLIDAEKLVLASGIPSVVLRLGGIYGPGRHRLKALREGKLKPSFGENYINRIHVQDIVAAILLLMEKGAAGQVYLGVDDHPSTQKEFYSWLCQKLNLAVPAENNDAPKMVHGSNKRCSNKKIKALGFKPKYPSFKEGYEPLLKEAVL